MYHRERAVPYRPLLQQQSTIMGFYNTGNKRSAWLVVSCSNLSLRFGGHWPEPSASLNHRFSDCDASKWPYDEWMHVIRMACPFIRFVHKQACSWVKQCEMKVKNEDYWCAWIKPLLGINDRGNRECCSVEFSNDLPTWRRGGALELTAITSARLHLVDIDLIRPSVLVQDRVRSGLVKLSRRICSLACSGEVTPFGTSQPVRGLLSNLLCKVNSKLWHNRLSSGCRHQQRREPKGLLRDYIHKWFVVDQVGENCGWFVHICSRGDANPKLV